MSIKTLYLTWGNGMVGVPWVPVGKLEQIDGLYYFRYTQGARQLAGFRPFPGMRNVETVYGSAELLPLFTNRLLSKSRPEYPAYLAWCGFEPAKPPGPLDILAVTEGRRQTDSIEVFPLLEPDVEGRFETAFFLRGFSSRGAEALERIDALHDGQQLITSPDASNRTDFPAVMVAPHQSDLQSSVGRLPRYLEFLGARCVPGSLRVSVARVNRRAPLQMRLLCHLSARWSSGYRPYDDDWFQPISKIEEPVGA